MTAANEVPIIAERAMWWPGPSSTTWAEAHVSPGSTETAPNWCLADGESGPGIDTYVLVANTSTHAGRIRATLFFEDGAPPVTAAFDVAPTSRFNIYPPVDFASSVEAITRQRFGVRVESLSGPGARPAAEIVVERAMYSSDGVHAWAAGSNALATPCP